MTDILAEATSVVQETIRAETLRRIEDLLTKYPNGMCAFVISSDLSDDEHIILATSNTTILGMSWLFVAAQLALAQGAAGDPDDTGCPTASDE